MKKLETGEFYCENQSCKLYLQPRPLRERLEERVKKAPQAIKEGAQAKVGKITQVAKDRKKQMVWTIRDALDASLWFWGSLTAILLTLNLMGNRYAWTMLPGFLISQAWAVNIIIFSAVFSLIIYLPFSLFTGKNFGQVYQGLKLPQGMIIAFCVVSMSIFVFRHLVWAGGVADSISGLIPTTDPATGRIITSEPQTAKYFNCIDTYTVNYGKGGPDKTFAAFSKSFIMCQIGSGDQLESQGKKVGNLYKTLGVNLVEGHANPRGGQSFILEFNVKNENEKGGDVEYDIIFIGATGYASITTDRDEDYKAELSKDTLGSGITITPQEEITPQVKFDLVPSCSEQFMYFPIVIESKQESSGRSTFYITSQDDKEGMEEFIEDSMETLWRPGPLNIHPFVRSSLRRYVLVKEEFEDQEYLQDFEIKIKMANKESGEATIKNIRFESTLPELEFITGMCVDSATGMDLGDKLDQVEILLAEGETRDIVCGGKINQDVAGTYDITVNYEYVYEQEFLPEPLQCFEGTVITTETTTTTVPDND